MSEEETRLIVVVGVTGTQGSSVASTFLQHTGWRVRGITRDPRSSKARAAAASSVEVVCGDLRDVASLRAAFLGAHAIFVATDYFSIVAQDSTAEEANALNIPVDKHAYDLEVQQGINAALAAYDPEVLSTLKRYVFSALPNVSRLSGGRYTRIYEFDSKEAILSHVHSQLPRLSSITSTVTLGYFAENWTKFPVTGPRKLADGTYQFEFVSPSSDVSRAPKLSYVVAGADTGKFVEALISKLPPGRNIQGVSDPMTPLQFATSWGRIKGLQTSVKAVTADSLAAGLPDFLQAGVVELFKFQSEYDYFDSDSDSVKPGDVGINTTTMEEYIRGLDWSA